MMTQYGAFTEPDSPFPSIEQAVDTLTALPWMEKRAVRAISMVTQRGSHGITGEVVSGTSRPDAADTVVYIVGVEHVVGGIPFSIRYLIEFGEADNGEDAGHEGNAGDEPGNETDSEEPDGGTEQGGEEPGDVPSDPSRPVDSGWDSIIDGDGSEYDDPADWTGEDDYY